MAQRARVASKTAFLDAAREWRAADVAAMARELPKLVAMRDDSGRTALRLLARGGADVHAVADNGATVGSLATRAQRRLLGIE